MDIQAINPRPKVKSNIIFNRQCFQERDLREICIANYQLHTMLIITFFNQDSHQNCYLFPIYIL
jgi:hypothetical protein